MALTARQKSGYNFYDAEGVAYDVPFVDEPLWYRLLVRVASENTMAEYFLKIAQSQEGKFKGVVTDAFYPKQEVVSFKGSKDKKVLTVSYRPMVPGFVYIKTRMNPDIADSLESVKGVRGLGKNMDGLVTPLGDAEADQIAVYQAKPDLVLSESALKMRVGEYCSFISGKHAGKYGIIEGVQNGLVTVRVRSEYKDFHDNVMWNELEWLENPPEKNYKTMTAKDAVEALMIKEPHSSVLKMLRKEGLLEEILYPDGRERGRGRDERDGDGDRDRGKTDSWGGDRGSTDTTTNNNKDRYGARDSERMSGRDGGRSQRSISRDQDVPFERRPDTVPNGKTWNPKGSSSGSNAPAPTRDYRENNSRDRDNNSFHNNNNNNRGYNNNNNNNENRQDRSQTPPYRSSPGSSYQDSPPPVARELSAFDEKRAAEDASFESFFTRGNAADSSRSYSGSGSDSDSDSRFQGNNYDNNNGYNYNSNFNNDNTNYNNNNKNKNKNNNDRSKSAVDSEFDSFIEQMLREADESKGKGSNSNNNNEDDFSIDMLGIGTGTGTGTGTGADDTGRDWNDFQFSDPLFDGFASSTISSSSSVSIGETSSTRNIFGKYDDNKKKKKKKMPADSSIDLESLFDDGDYTPISQISSGSSGSGSSRRQDQGLGRKNNKNNGGGTPEIGDFESFEGYLQALVSFEGSPGGGGGSGRGGGGGGGVGVGVGGGGGLGVGLGGGRNGGDGDGDGGGSSASASASSSTQYSSPLSASPSGSSLGSMSVKDLKEQCKAAGLKVGGTKAELVDRLAAAKGS